MKNSNKNPEQEWANLIHEFGDDHEKLTPKLATAFSSDPRSLMNQISWFKFGGKMIGQKDRVLVYDHLEGLGGWTVGCETGRVVSVLDPEDPVDDIREAWNDERINFETDGEKLICSADAFDGLVRFDAAGKMTKAEWTAFIKGSTITLKQGGVLVTGSTDEQLFTFLKDKTKKHFSHVFTFGHDRPHPLINPADIKIILAC